MSKTPHPKAEIRSLLKSNLTGNEKIVLSVLWAHSNDNGECWPSITTMVDETSLGRASVFRALASLKANDILSPHENPKVKTNAYKIHYERVVGITQRRVSERDGSQSETSKGLTQRRIGSQRDTYESHTETSGVSHRDCIYNEEVPNEVHSEAPIEEYPPIVPQSDEDELDRKIDEYLAEFETMWLSWDKTIPLEKHVQNILDTTNAPYSTAWCFCNAALNYTKTKIRNDFTDSLKARQNAGETLSEWEIHIVNGVDWAVFQYLDPHIQNINRVFEGKNPMEGHEAFQPYYDSAIHEACKKTRDLWMYRKLRGL